MKQFHCVKYLFLWYLKHTERQSNYNVTVSWLQRCNSCREGGGWRWPWRGGRGRGQPEDEQQQQQQQQPQHITLVEKEEEKIAMERMMRKTRRTNRRWTTTKTTRLTTTTTTTMSTRTTTTKNWTIDNVGKWLMTSTVRYGSVPINDTPAKKAYHLRTR